jgi:hypothetical protein
MFSRFKDHIWRTDTWTDSTSPMRPFYALHVKNAWASTWWSFIHTKCIDCTHDHNLLITLQTHIKQNTRQKGTVRCVPKNSSYRTVSWKLPVHSVEALPKRTELGNTKWHRRSRNLCVCCDTGSWNPWLTCKDIAVWNVVESPLGAVWTV